MPSNTSRNTAPNATQNAEADAARERQKGHISIYWTFKGFKLSGVDFKGEEITRTYPTYESLKRAILDHFEPYALRTVITTDNRGQGHPETAVDGILKIGAARIWHVTLAASTNAGIAMNELGRKLDRSFDLRMPTTRLQEAPEDFLTEGMEPIVVTPVVEAPPVEMPSQERRPVRRSRRAPVVAEPVEEEMPA
jgi:hypothetical protein